MKIYATRDSATATLKKLGINKVDYAKFITKNDDGRFTCHTTKAQAFLATPAKPTPGDGAADSGNPLSPTQLMTSNTPTAAKLKKTPTVKPAAKPKPTKKQSTAAVARELILAGKTNEQVWEVLKTKHGLSDDKRHYPSWYRSELKRKGLVK